MTRDEIFQAINLERQQQIAKWGEQHHDNYTWLAILIEEIGESAQAALHDMFGGWAAGNLGNELIHASTVIVAWLEDKQ